jgi:hypothetical protein
MRIPLRIPSPRRNRPEWTTHAGVATENGLEIYDHSSKSHQLLSWERLMSLRAQALGLASPNAPCGLFRKDEGHPNGQSQPGA